MSYQIGQFKRTDYSGLYETTLDNLIYGKQNSIYNSNVEDGTLKLNNENFIAGEVYKLKTTLNANRNDFNGQIQIKLSDGNNKYQILKNFSMIGTNKNLNLIFMPHYNFNSIVFEIVRTGSNSNTDISIEANENVTTLSKMTNVLTTSAISKDKVRKVGIQGPEGMNFAINGSLIKMGKSGIFMSKEMDITSVCFVVENRVSNKDEYGDPIWHEDKKTFFIMDYQY